MISEMNTRCTNEFADRLKEFLDAGYDFPYHQQQEYLQFCMENPYWLKNMDRSLSMGSLVEKCTYAHKTKRKLTLLRLGIDIFTPFWHFTFRTWGTPPTQAIAVPHPDLLILEPSHQL